jgi:bacterioferritin
MINEEAKSITSKAAEPRKRSFLTDIQEIRRRARQHIQDGAVTDSYKGDRTVVLRVLNEALATEIVCVLRYKRHHYMAKGITRRRSRKSFLSMRPKSRVTPIRLRKESRNWRGAELQP